MIKENYSVYFQPNSTPSSPLKSPSLYSSRLAELTSDNDNHPKESSPPALSPLDPAPWKRTNGLSSDASSSADAKNDMATGTKSGLPVSQSPMITLLQKNRGMNFRWSRV